MKFNPFFYLSNRLGNKNFNLKPNNRKSLSQSYYFKNNKDDENFKENSNKKLFEYDENIIKENSNKKISGNYFRSNEFHFMR